MFKQVTGLDIGVGANGQYDAYEVPGSKMERPITIAGFYTGTYNLDGFLLWAGADSKIAWLDNTLNKGTPYQMQVGHLNGWMNPAEHIMFQVTNFALAGYVSVNLWLESVSREEAAPQAVRIAESVNINTRPWGGLFK